MTQKMMAGEEKIKKLQVHMLGALFLTYGDDPISLNCSISNKAMQLLLLLLYSGENGIDRKELLEALYGRENSANPTNSLNATVFRLKKLLVAAGLPEEKYISTDKGIYRWIGSVPVVVDAHEFEKTAKMAFDAQGDEQLALFKEACKRYSGEFLPDITGEEWVAIAGVRYQKLYFACLKEACARMQEAGEYAAMLQLCTAATAIYPFEEWQALQIDCLMAMHHYKEAMKVYEDATEMLFEEMGIPPSEAMLGRFRALNGQLHYATGALSDIMSNLSEEEWKPCAYRCTYPGFIDCYQMVSRIMERTNKNACMVSCTLVDENQQPLEEGETLLRYATRLDAAIGHSLRRGDAYTGYSPNQFLALLMDADTVDSRKVIDRINQAFHSKESGSRVMVNYDITDIRE
ncbi:MAG: BTAD domain-containing putative transcriptional regulator [Hungatella sp.]